MRLIIEVGLVKENEAIELKAMAERRESHIGRWLSANLSVRNFLAVVTVVGTLITVEARRESRITALEVGEHNISALAARNADKTSATNVRISEQTVPLSCYLHDQQVIEQRLETLTDAAIHHREGN